MNLSAPCVPADPRAPRVPLVPLALRAGAWSRRSVRAACLALAILPAVFIGGEVAAWVRNIPHWDEFDTVLDLLVELESSPGASRVAELLLAPNNEHRMLLSRLLFATSYWVTGGINFAAIAVVGNLFLLAAVVTLVWSARGGPARLRLAAVLGAFAFQLQHHENFFWGGSSIDHFLVVLAAVAALRALEGGSGLALAGGVAAGTGATFTLAHGLLVWPLGVLLLAAQRRGRAVAIWSAAAGVNAALYFHGFALNPGHPRPAASDLPAVITQALTLLGASPALGHRGLAPVLGAVFLAALAALAWRGAGPRDRLALAVAAWAAGSLALVAWGRTLIMDPWAPLTSRYFILSALAWAMLLWVAWERLVGRRGEGPLVVAPVLIALLAFNVAASSVHEGVGRSFARIAERGAWNYHCDGTFSLSPPFLYPDPERADRLLRACADRGLYRLPPPAALTLAEPALVPVAESTEIADAAYFIESVRTVADSVVVRGWAFRRQHRLREGDIAVLFRSADRLLACEATPLHRPDVAREFKRTDATYSGFRVRVPRAALPAGRLQIGVGFDLDGEPEHMMTAHTVENPLE